MRGKWEGEGFVDLALKSAQIDHAITILEPRKCGVSERMAAQPVYLGHVEKHVSRQRIGRALGIVEALLNFLRKLFAEEARMKIQKLVGAIRFR